MYVPPYYDGVNEKLILLYNLKGSLGTHYPVIGSKDFKGCPVSKCTITMDESKASSANAIIFDEFFTWPNATRPADQVWILFNQESPVNRPLHKFSDVFNWTATYRKDSDIVAPYARWYYYDTKVKFKTPKRNYAAKKKKKVAWYVSNCQAHNHRLEYATELDKYIQVDIYGECGKLKCPRFKRKSCHQLLKNNYKFYLAFENSNCKNYITEKFYYNALHNELLPIVMGPPPEDYDSVVPIGSYIHVDDFSGPEELASYLHKLDMNDTLYNEYFKWKNTGQLIDPHIWCRLCAILHGRIKRKYYKDINKWLREPNVCTQFS